MPTEHAKLSPSSAERWLSCTASVRMIEANQPREESSPYAQEGTRAHDLAEIELGRAFGLNTPDQYRKWRQVWETSMAEEQYDRDTIEEMDDYISGFVEFVTERFDEFPGSAILLEQRLPAGVPDVWGTSDVVIYSPEHVEIIDLKYGMGHKVAAQGNPQLRLYALGALEEYGTLLGEVRQVRSTVFQPRKDHADTETLTPAELLFWRKEFAIPQAEKALGPDGMFAPSEAACRWCPVAGICRARMESLADQDFNTKPDALSRGEMGDALSRAPEVRDWLKALEAAALELMYTDGEEIPGWKAVMSGGRRKITDESAALTALTRAGVDRGAVATEKLTTLAKLEKAVGGKDKLHTILGDIMGHTPGRPAIAPATDHRPAVDQRSSAQADFA